MCFFNNHLIIQLLCIQLKYDEHILHERHRINKLDQVDHFPVDV